MVKSYRDYFKTGELSLEQQSGYLLGSMYDSIRDYQLTHDTKYLDKLQDLKDQLKSSNYSLTSNNKYPWYGKLELQNMTDTLSIPEILDKLQLKLLTLSDIYQDNLSVDDLIDMQVLEHSSDYHTKLVSLKFLAYEEAISNEAFLRLKSQLKKDFEKVKNDFADEYNDEVDDQ